MVRAHTKKNCIYLIKTNNRDQENFGLTIPTDHERNSLIHNIFFEIGWCHHLIESQELLSRGLLKASLVYRPNVLCPYFKNLWMKHIDLFK